MAVTHDRSLRRPLLWRVKKSALTPQLLRWITRVVIPSLLCLLLSSVSVCIALNNDCSSSRSATPRAERRRDLSSAPSCAKTLAPRTEIGIRYYEGPLNLATLYLPELD